MRDYAGAPKSFLDEISSRYFHPNAKRRSTRESYTDLRTGDVLEIRKGPRLSVLMAEGASMILHDGAMQYSVDEREKLAAGIARITNLGNKRRGKRNYIRIQMPRGESTWHRYR